MAAVADFKFIKFTRDDLLMWAGIAIFSVILIAIFMIFTTTSPVAILSRILAALYVVFLPGYLIVKLYFDDVYLTANRPLDKFIFSFAASLVTVQTLAFIIQYYTVYIEDIGQEMRIRMAEWMPVIISTVVMAAAVVGRFFWDRIVAAWRQAQSLVVEKLGESVGQPLFLALTLLFLLGVAWLFLELILWIMWKSL